MPARALTGWVAAIFAFGGTSLLARDAFALACTVSTDCPKGFDCVPTHFLTDGAVAEGTCISGQCQSDSDCATGFRCLFDTASLCTIDADGGQDCQPDNICAPQWEVPCTANSQCGPGFTCLDGGPLPDAASVAATGGSYECGSGAFDASIPSYATAAWISCSEIPLPPEPPSCDGDAGDGDTVPLCPPVLCEAGTMCLAIVTYSCTSPASGQSCQSEADCPSTWTCACPPVTCATEVLLPPDAGPIADAGCTTVCTPPNSDLNPSVIACAGPASSSAPTTPSGAVDAASPANPTSGNGARPTDSVQGGGCGTAPGRAAGDSPALLLLAVVLAAARARARRTLTKT